jgi:hypothetical protein
MSLLNEIFDKIFVINLPVRNDKMDLMKYKLGKLNIKYEKFVAIDGNSDDIRELVEDIMTRNKTLQTKGAVGLLLTYNKLLEHIRCQKYVNVLLLEDDCNFVNNFETFIKKLEDVINGNMVTYLGANQFLYDTNQSKEINEQNGFYTLSMNPIYMTFGTYAIHLRNDFVNILYQYLNNCIKIREKLYEIDIFIQNLLRQYNSHAKIMYPFLIMPDVTTSDVSASRNQLEFCSTRKYDMTNYNYLSINTINNVKNILDINNISLRQILWKHYDNNTKISKNTLTEIIKTIQTESSMSGEFYDNMCSIINFIISDNEINIYDLFDLVEGYDNKFAFVVPSFNNKDNYLINISSFANQLYPSYLSRMIYIDDKSNDDTFNLVDNQITKLKLQNRIKLIKQHKKGFQCLGRYLGYHLSYDDEIVIFLDGDDWLASYNVLQILNQSYKQKNILASYGAFYIYHDESLEKKVIEYGSLNGTRIFPNNVIEQSSYNNYEWISGHLRTCYAKLIKLVKIKDLISSDGTFYKISTDRAEMIPILEMAGNRHMNIKQGLYVYNKANSIKYYSSYYNSTFNNNVDTRKRIIMELKNRDRYIKLYPEFKEDLLAHQSIENIVNPYHDELFPITDLRDVLKKEYTNLQYVIYGKLPGLEDFIILKKYAKQTGAFIITNKQLIPKICNYINEDGSYVAFRIGSNTDLLIDHIVKFPGLYHVKTLIDYLIGQNTLENEIVICGNVL